MSKEIWNREPSKDVDMQSDYEKKRYRPVVDTMPHWLLRATSKEIQKVLHKKHFLEVLYG